MIAHQDRFFHSEHRRPSAIVFVLLLMSAMAVITSPCLAQDASAKPAEAKSKKEKKNGGKQKDAKKWIELKDKWVSCEFGGEGDVEIKKGVIAVSHGSPISGVKWTGKIGDKKNGKPAKGEKGLPRDNFEIELEARRVDGFDFFCALTFPVGKSHASFVMGGWGGGITGISSIDGRDASDNETTLFQSFDNDKWYKARVRVDVASITVWVDDEKLFDHPRKGHEFDIRFEMDPSTPLGLANYECISEYRNIRIRRLSEKEIAAAKKAAESEE